MSALRLEMNITLHKNGRVVSKVKRFSKSRLKRFLTEKTNSEWDSGTIKVWYSRANDYWNAGNFETIEEFEHLLADFTERPLVEAFA